MKRRREPSPSNGRRRFSAAPLSLWGDGVGRKPAGEGSGVKGGPRLARRASPRHLLPEGEGKRASLVELARLFRQHDRDPIADRIGQPCGARNELLPNRIVSELCPRHGAHQDLQEASIDFRRRLGSFAGGRFSASSLMGSSTSARRLRSAKPRPDARHRSYSLSRRPQEARSRRSKQARSPSLPVRPARARRSQY